MAEPTAFARVCGSTKAAGSGSLLGFLFSAHLGSSCATATTLFLCGLTILCFFGLAIWTAIEYRLFVSLRQHCIMFIRQYGVMYRATRTSTLNSLVKMEAHLLPQPWWTCHLDNRGSSWGSSSLRQLRVQTTHVRPSSTTWR